MRVKENKPVADRAAWLAPVSILLLAIIAYIPAMHGGFIWDDNALLTECRPVKAANGLYAIWFTTELVDWLPMTITSFWLEWRLWGPSPYGYHVTNIILHAISAVLLWRVLRQLKIPGAWAAALLFAVHPVCVASVAWIAERKNTLSLVFYLLSLLWYFRFDSEPKQKKWFILSLAAFLLALLSKGSVVVLPAVLLLCIWWLRGRVTKTDVIRALPFFGLGFVMGLATMYFQHRGVGFSDDSMLVRLIGGSWALWFYLGKILAPVNLTMIYHRWEINPGSVIVWLPGLLFIALAGVLWRYRHGWGRACLFALGYFVIVLGPVLGVFNMAYFAISRVSDHLQYLAIPGILALVAAGGAQFLAKFGSRIQTAATVIVAMVLAVLTWQHAHIFARPETLWADNIKKNPGAWRVHNSLGAELFHAGNNEEAIKEYQEALRLEPNAGDAHYNLGNAFYRAGQKEKAVTEFLNSIKNHGKETYNAENNAGIALTELGRWEEAIAHYKAAIQYKESFAEAHRNLGVAYLHMQRAGEARTEFETALQYDPTNAGAQEGLGAAMVNSGDTESALALLRKAVQLNPQSPTAYRNMAMALAKQGKLPEAVEQFQKSISLNPDDAYTHADLADALVRLGRLDDAKAQFEESLKFNPTNAVIHNSYGTLLDKKGDLEGARVQFEESIKIDPAGATAHKNLGLILARKQKYPEAIRQFQEVLKLKPADADTESELGNTYGRNNQPDDALIHFQAAVKLDPNNAGAHNGLGVVMDIKGRTDDALNEFQTAVKLKPDLVRAHVNAANLLLKKNRREEAIAEYQTALKLQPNNAEAKQQLQLLK